MKLHNNTLILFGPPGTGKTTRLINEVESMLTKARANEICYLAFTNKAADVAKDRANRFRFVEFKYFSTIHSFVYRLSERKRIVGFKDMCNFARSKGYYFSINSFDTVSESNSNLSFGDKIFSIYKYAQSKRIGFKEAISNFNDFSIKVKDLLKFEEEYESFKKSINKIDFSDMLLDFIEKSDCPVFKYLIVDEAQDLSMLQWETIKKISSNVTEKVVIAGDDDQAIFGWAGACPEVFMNLEGTQEVLEKSYRLPKKIYRLSISISSKIKNRKTKTWKPKEESGVIHRNVSLFDINIKESSDSWLLLTRNKQFILNFESSLLSNNFLFESETSNLLPLGTLSVISNWEKLIKGKSITAREFRQLLRFIGASHFRVSGKKELGKTLTEDKLIDWDFLHDNYGLSTSKSWDKVLTLFDVQIKYIKEALGKGHSLENTGKIKISTIHTAKGDEADNVILCLDMSFSSYKFIDTDEEKRVWYVAASRAKKELFLLKPMTSRFYNIIS